MLAMPSKHYDGLGHDVIFGPVQGSTVDVIVLSVSQNCSETSNLRLIHCAQKKGANFFNYESCLLVVFYKFCTLGSRNEYLKYL